MTFVILFLFCHFSERLTHFFVGLDDYKTLDLMDWFHIPLDNQKRIVAKQKNVAVSLDSFEVFDIQKYYFARGDSLFLRTLSLTIWQCLFFFWMVTRWGQIRTLPLKSTQQDVQIRKTLLFKSFLASLFALLPDCFIQLCSLPPCNHYLIQSFT